MFTTRVHSKGLIRVSDEILLQSHVIFAHTGTHNLTSKNLCQHWQLLLSRIGPRLRRCKFSKLKSWTWSCECELQRETYDWALAFYFNLVIFYVNNEEKFVAETQEKQSAVFSFFQMSAFYRLHRGVFYLPASRSMKGGKLLSLLVFIASFHQMLMDSGNTVEEWGDLDIVLLYCCLFHQC